MSYGIWDITDEGERRTAGHIIHSRARRKRKGCVKDNTEEPLASSSRLNTPPLATYLATPSKRQLTPDHQQRKRSFQLSDSCEVIAASDFGLPQRVPQKLEQKFRAPCFTELCINTNNLLLPTETPFTSHFDPSQTHPQRPIQQPSVETFCIAAPALPPSSGSESLDQRSINSYGRHVATEAQRFTSLTHFDNAELFTRLNEHTLYDLT